MTALTIHAVAAEDGRLAALTYPRYAHLLAADMLRQPDVGVLAATRAGEPIGLALLARQDDGEARLLSLAVAPAWRRQGAGMALMEAAAQWARGRALPSLHTLYGGNMRGLDAWQGLLARAGWTAPELYLLSLTGRADWAAEARREWDELFDRLDETGFAITPWQDRTGQDDAELARLAESAGRMAAGLVDAPLPGPSVVIREHGRPVGWVLATEGAKPGDVFYPVGYVVPRLQRTGWLIGALVEACVIQERLFGTDGTCSFQTAGDNRAMQAFMLRRLDKWTIRRTRHYKSSKSLSP